MTTEILSTQLVYDVVGQGPYAIENPYTTGAIRAAVVLGEVRAELTLNTDFTVNPTSTDTTGDLTLSVAAAATYAGAKLYISRETDPQQGWQGVSNSREKGLEAQLDATVQAVQELRVSERNVLRTDRPLAPFVPVEGKTLIFDSNLNPIPGPTATAIAEAEIIVADVGAALDKAEAWADESEDVEVEPSKFSARHWATKAAISSPVRRQRTTADAASAASVANDGDIIILGGVAYLYDSTAVGSASATADLGVDGFRVVETFDARAFGLLPGLTPSENVAAIRRTLDAALAYIQTGPGLGAFVRLPAGNYAVNDELLSDDFQEKWWLQTSLFKQKFIVVEGVSSGGTILSVHSSWPSGVRNTTNGNQRTYGPWANSPSPAALWPVIATKSGAPAAFSLRHMRMTGSRRHGKDPVAWLSMNELDANSHDLHVSAFDNWGEVLMGSFNSSRAYNHFESCGAQPVEAGIVLGGRPGFPENRVKFNYDAGTNTISAFCRAAFGGYAVDDPVPFFQPSHVGKMLAIHSIDASGDQVAKPTITAVAGDNLSATVTIPPGVADQNRTGIAASFFPIKATTTANSAVVTVSSPIVLGDGAADMIGQLVCIPKAGSLADPNLDLFTSRIISCDVGDDTNGYTQFTLADQAAVAVTEDFITGVGHACISDENSHAGNLTWNVNDTDFIQCRWEQSGGYGADVTTGAYQFIIQDPGEGVQYVSCKMHGANSTQGQFAADGSAIIDSSIGVDFIGTDFTHMSLSGRGQVRLMGARQRARMASVAVAGWQIPHDWSAFYIDPKSGADPDEWAVYEDGTTVVKNRSFPRNVQRLFGKSASLNTAQMLEYRYDHKTQIANSSILLDANDDLDDILVPGNYHWLASSPVNAPGFPSYSLLEVLRCGGSAVQRMTDINNSIVLTRYRFAGAWQAWRLVTPRVEPSSSFSGAGSLINTVGKFAGTVHFNTTVGKLYVASGSAPTDAWNASDGSSGIVPS